MAKNLLAIQRRHLYIFSLSFFNFITIPTKIAAIHCSSGVQVTSCSTLFSGGSLDQKSANDAPPEPEGGSGLRESKIPHPPLPQD